MDAGHVRRKHQPPWTVKSRSGPGLAWQGRLEVADPIFDDRAVSPDSAANHQGFTVFIKMDRKSGDARPMDLGHRFRPGLRRIDIDENANRIVQGVYHRN